MQRNNKQKVEYDKVSLCKTPANWYHKTEVKERLHPVKGCWKFREGFTEEMSFKCSFGGPPWWFLVAQTVKHLPAMWETRVQFLGREDPLEKEMAIHSSTLAWKIPWTEEPGRLQSMRSQRVGHD